MFVGHRFESGACLQPRLIMPSPLKAMRTGEASGDDDEDEADSFDSGYRTKRADETGPRANFISTSRRARRNDYRFFYKKKRTSNQEGGPRVLRGGLPIIRPLPIVSGSAADRSPFFLLNGVVRYGPHAHSTSTSRRAGRDGR